jgi:predicted N-formylglutamate amidohydrolase
MTTQMTQVAKPVSPAAGRVPYSAAERVRAYRQRQRDGLRCLMIEIRHTEIAALIRRGMLKADERHDLDAIRDAVHAHLDRTLDVTP